MAISAAHIIAYMTSPLKVNDPGISIQIRNKVEWTWGLGHNYLDEHLGQFTDALHLFADDSLFVIPSKDMISDIQDHFRGVKLGDRRPHIRKLYRGRTSFEYFVIPIDSKNPLPSRKVVSEVPPHIAVATTCGKVVQQWGYLVGAAYDAVRASLIERSEMVPGSTLSLHDLDSLQHIYRTWTLGDYVPASFLSEDSDETMIEAEDLDSPYTTPAPAPSVSNDKNKTDSEVRSSASGEHSPRRRLYPHEIEQDIHDQPDEDDYASGVEEPTEADSEEDRWWLEGIMRWAEGTKAARDEGILLNDSQIQEDPREEPRVATSVDLARPDYLSRRTTRTA
ncbi:hypothetical protein B0H15DRAFT_955101 [Mycena belliarum]|uniref:Uncharacterized protein n=1 Tax=Mycena belliarum TaxID=1033014 RepID=A0AAD6XIR1_9AGAR|nr:hypothetical protein B0H15DRAFT_955101 [Mycena belliae]